MLLLGPGLPVVIRAHHVSKLVGEGVVLRPAEPAVNVSCASSLLGPRFRHDEGEIGRVKRLVAPTCQNVDLLALSKMPEVWTTTYVLYISALALDTCKSDELPKSLVRVFDLILVKVDLLNAELLEPDRHAAVPHCRVGLFKERAYLVLGVGKFTPTKIG